MGVARDLQLQIGRALGVVPGGAENPLVALGLTEHILNLGLSDDDLYEHVRAMSRQLVVKFHPDRGVLTPHAAERQQKFSAAFDQVKNRAVFDAALTELRGNYNILRTAENEAKLALRAAQSELEAVKGELEAFRNQAEGEKELRRDERGRFSESLLANLFGASLQVHQGAGVLSIPQCKAVTVLSFSSEGSRRVLASREEIDKFRRRYIYAVQKARRSGELKPGYWEPLISEAHALGLGDTTIEELLRHALGSRDSFPLFSWRPQDGFTKAGFPAIAFGQDRVPLLGRGVVTSPELVSSYWDGLRVVARLLAEKDPVVSEVRAKVHRVPVDAGRFTPRLEGQQQILGAIDPKNLEGRWGKNRFVVRSPREDRNRTLKSEVGGKDILQSMVPLLWPGALLVTVPIISTGKLQERPPRESVAQLRIDSFDRVRAIYAHHLILAVERKEADPRSRRKR